MGALTREHGLVLFLPIITLPSFLGELSGESGETKTKDATSLPRKPKLPLKDFRSFTKHSPLSFPLSRLVRAQQVSQPKTPTFTLKLPRSRTAQSERYLYARPSPAKFPPCEVMSVR